MEHIKTDTIMTFQYDNLEEFEDHRKELESQGYYKFLRYDKVLGHAQYIFKEYYSKKWEEIGL